MDRLDVNAILATLAAPGSIPDYFRCFGMGQFVPYRQWNGHVFEQGGKNFGMPNQQQVKDGSCISDNDMHRD